MTANVLIPDDLHQQLRERAAKSDSTVDEFAVRLMRAAIGLHEDHPIRQDGRFAYFDLPENAQPLDLDRIQAALHD
jgi:plasmid stability protein